MQITPREPLNPIEYPTYPQVQFPAQTFVGTRQEAIDAIVAHFTELPEDAYTEIAAHSISSNWARVVKEVAIVPDEPEE